jgi:hypothetical protein
MTANDLIARSARHTEIVTAEWTEDLAVDLLLDCEDNCDVNGRIEFWGRNDAGEWRVHLIGAPA